MGILCLCAHATHVLRSVLSGEELTRLRTALEEDGEIVKNSYARDDGHGRLSRMCLWNHPGNDITGIIGRCEKVAGTMEKASLQVWLE